MSSSFSASSSSVSGSAIHERHEQTWTIQNHDDVPLSMNSCAACLSSSNFSDVSSGPAGSRSIAGISFSFLCAANSRSCSSASLGGKNWKSCLLCEKSGDVIQTGGRTEMVRRSRTVEAALVREGSLALSPFSTALRAWHPCSKRLRSSSACVLVLTEKAG